MGDKHAWVCSLDEEFLGWGCIKVSIKKINDLRLLKYGPSPGFFAKKRSSAAFEETTNEHKV